MAGDLWFFDRIAPAYDLLAPSADGSALRMGLQRADGEVDRVLDVAGGTGRASAAIEADRRVVLDASERMLRGTPPGIDRVRGDAGRLPVASEAIDVVLIVDALHHLPDPETALAEAERVLRPGGAIVIQEFDPTTVRGRLLRGGEHLLGMDSGFFAPGELLSLLADAGFDARLLRPGFDALFTGHKPERDRTRSGEIEERVGDGIRTRNAFDEPGT